VYYIKRENILKSAEASKQEKVESIKHQANLRKKAIAPMQKEGKL